MLPGLVEKRNEMLDQEHVVPDAVVLADKNDLVVLELAQNIVFRRPGILLEIAQKLGLNLRVKDRQRKLLDLGLLRRSRQPGREGQDDYKKGERERFIVSYLGTPLIRCRHGLTIIYPASHASVSLIKKKFIFRRT